MTGNNKKPQSLFLMRKQVNGSFSPFLYGKKQDLLKHAAIREGKAAVFYNGATLGKPPELFIPPELPAEE